MLQPTIFLALFGSALASLRVRSPDLLPTRAPFSITDVLPVNNCENVTHSNDIDYVTFGSPHDGEGLWGEICSFHPPYISDVDAEEYRYSAYIKLTVDSNTPQKSVVFGFMYNVQSIENYDFILLRSARFGCLVSGYVKDTSTYYYKGGDAMDRGKRCDLAIANNHFFRLEITVSANRHIQVKIDGELVTHEKEEWCESLHKGRVGIMGLRTRGHGMAIQQAELTIIKEWGPNHPANITYFPRNLVVNAGESAEFRCGSTHQHDTIKWFRYITSNGRRILISTNQHFNITGKIDAYTLRPLRPSGALLKINRASLTDAGLYRCVSKEANKEGLACLTVVRSIVCFNDPPDMSNLQLRQKVRFNCTVTYSGRNGPRLQWATATGKRIRGWTTVSRSEVSSQVEFRFRPSHKSIVILCRIYFSNAHPESPMQGLVLAPNIPSYTYVHPFPPLAHDPKAGFGTLHGRIGGEIAALKTSDKMEQNGRSSEFITKVVASIFGSAIFIVIGVFLAIYWKKIYVYIQRRRGLTTTVERQNENSGSANVRQTATYL